MAMSFTTILSQAVTGAVLVTAFAVTGGPNSFVDGQAAFGSANTTAFYGKSTLLKLATTENSSGFLGNAILPTKPAGFSATTKLVSLGTTAGGRPDLPSEGLVVYDSSGKGYTSPSLPLKLALTYDTTGSVGTNIAFPSPYQGQATAGAGIGKVGAASAYPDVYRPSRLFLSRWLTSELFCTAGTPVTELTYSKGSLPVVADLPMFAGNFTGPSFGVSSVSSNNTTTRLPGFTWG